MLLVKLFISAAIPDVPHHVAVQVPASGHEEAGYPAYSHQSYSHQVGICHSVEGWEYDTVTFPPYTNIMINTALFYQRR